jgi:hypothetical protein
MRRLQFSRPGRRLVLAAAAIVSIAAALPASNAQAASCARSADAATGAVAGPSGRVRQLPLTISSIEQEAHPVLGTDGRYNVAYALMVQNVTPRVVRITGFDVVDASNGDTAGRAVVRGFRGEDIDGKVSLSADRGGIQSDSYSASVPPGQSGYIYVNVVFRSRAAVPCRLAHRVTAILPDVPGKPRFRALAARLPVSRTDALVLSPPLRGRDWLNLDGCCKEIGPHRFTVLTPNGRPRNPQAFAIDFLQLDASGRYYKGNPKKNENWKGFGADIYAAAPGRVIQVRRNMPDNVPGSFPSTTTINNAGGNMVITEVGPGQYVAYGHMVKGSVTVRVGDRVRRGQKLGRLGNSGNSDAPHLHFQVMNKPSLVDADPLPFVFDTMRLDGQFRGTAEQLDESLVSDEPLRFNRSANGNRNRQMPLTGDLLRFQ